MNMIQEFQKFVMRGNVVDMAVGVIIGGAFGKIVSSLVADVVMPPIGVLLGGMNFADLAITVKEAVDESPAVVIAYGKFLQTVIDFVIVAMAIFLMVKLVSDLRRRFDPPPPPPPPPPVEQQLLAEIRDLLKQRSH